MPVRQGDCLKSGLFARLLGATALVCLLSGPLQTVPAAAQSIPLEDATPTDSEMLLEADTLIYDHDNNTVTAVGGVRIDYGGNKLVAQRVVYDRNTSRLLATGNVQIVDTTGTVIYSDEIDITDDFADGFANALRIETVDKTYFAAESGERKGGVVTTFNNGVYTACEPCEEKPDKAPIWRVKARKIIWDGKAKTVRFENSRFEMFGFPIAYLPAFEVADPTVKRKTGFLFPGISYKSELGVGVHVPFYVALSPTYDLTLYGNYYRNQGFMGAAEWRQRFNSGQYSIKIAGIRQQSPGAFAAGSINAGTLTDPNRNRGMIGTKGHFRINPRWTFGWDILAQSDKNFAYTYAVGGYNGYVHRSQVYLTGLSGRNFFNVSAYRFNVQEDVADGVAGARNDLQPAVLPTMDYAYTAARPIAGGELSFDVNVQALDRDRLDASASATPVVRGVSGMTGRLTAEAEWKRSVVTDGGLVITPLLAVRGDTIYASVDGATVAGINNMAASQGLVSDIRNAYHRFMATAGLELRWPVLFSMTNASHVIEPMAQVFARPDAAFASTVGIPNEDAQSFVFDATSLFERDKFSGYDRIEGGTRVNAGVRYSGKFNGWTTSAIFGQSYHVAGQNSFASPDLVNVGAFSGLETPKSDFVALAGFSSPFGLSASASARFDEQTGEVRRAEGKVGLALSRLSVTGKYAYIQAQPLYGFATDRREVTVGASARLHEYWRVFGSATYDFQSSVLVSDSIGFAYDDECFSYSMTVAESRNRTTKEVSQSIGFNLSFRTIGDFGSGSLSESSF